MAVTDNYSWQKPTVGGDSGTWGTTLNTDLDAIDSDLKDVSDAADAAQTDADAAQATADDAYHGLQAITPTAITLSDGDPYTGTIDLSDEGVVYRITQSHSYTSTDCNLTFTNRPVGVNRIIYLHFIISVTGGGSIFLPKIASASKQWVLPMDTAVSGSGTQSLTGISGTQQIVYPLLVIGS